MTIYNHFATFYQQGDYLRFSERLVESVLPLYLGEMAIEPVDILDVACGEGSFAVGMSKLGYKMTGIDQSQRMIELAQARAKKESAQVNFLVEDMRSLSFNEAFDLVTCFFDSMNYLLTVNDLQETLQGVYNALRPGGTFIFDMNTIYGLAVVWMQEETYVQKDSDDFIEIHRQSFDYENEIATMLITVFKRKRRLWERIDEVHQERGYPLADIQLLLLKNGFEIAGMYGNLSNRTDVHTTTPRVWFAARKP